jgi:ubiquinone/menaquinone biosynthesis C-methylase UbiE
VTRKKTLLDQCRKPTGWRGRFILWKMNRGHSDMTDWGLSHVSIEKSDTILDIGCGGGRTVSKLAAIAAQGHVCGIDYSPDSVATSRKTNAQGVAAGRVEIQQGSVSKLPFPDSTFDLVTAVETHFFWPDLPSDMREVFRVLKPGGSFIVIVEVYKGANKMAEKLAKKFPSTAMNLLSMEEHRELFAQTGYVEIQVIEQRDREWLCSVGRKPSLPKNA